MGGRYSAAVLQRLTFSRRRQIGAAAVGDVGGQADGFAQRRMRMVDGAADGMGVATLADGQRDLADHVAGVGTGDGPAQQPAVRMPEDELGQAIFGAVGNGPPGSRPGKARDIDGQAATPGFVFRQADPGDFGQGVRDAGNQRVVITAVQADGGFGRDVALMHRLVRQHRRPRDVADGENVRDIGRHPLVDRDETRLAYRHSGPLGADAQAVRLAPDGLENHVVALCLGRRHVALEAHPGTLRIDMRRHGARAQHDVVEAVAVLHLPDFRQLAIGAG